MFYIAFFLKGLAITLLSGSIESIYVESVNSDNLIKYNTLERLIFFSSFALAALLGGYLVDIFSYEKIIFIDIFMSFIVIVIISLFKENKENYRFVKDDVTVKECFKFALEKKTLIVFIYN